jgi:2-polyprenyl-6-hydroxyphenyl methylase/3-demethylubiquinone-9 3-methyltransferase
MIDPQSNEAAQQHTSEVKRGERFEFGKNWSSFLAVLDDRRIAKAEESLREMLEVETLVGKRFLDIGSGSGLFSLAARRLGARVHSFDYDADSVACTAELRRLYFDGDTDWTVEQGSALDLRYIRSLGVFDVVYSWGVLHHTGRMWDALGNTETTVAPGGKLFIAIYNDTGTQSARWLAIKKLYNQTPRFLRAPLALAVYLPGEIKTLARCLLTLKPIEYIRSWTQYRNARGMDRWHDLVDWIGGYPYEYAAAEEIFEFYRARGYKLMKLRTKGVGLGCNEFVFERDIGRGVGGCSADL